MFIERKLHSFLCRLKYLVIIVSLCFSCLVKGQEVYSPGGEILFNVKLETGQLFYEVDLNGQVMLEPSPLGLETSIGDFSSVLTYEGSTVSDINEHYALSNGKISEIEYKAKKLVCSYKNQKGQLLDVIVQVSDTDIAISYRISSQKDRRIIITRELTGFNFPGNAAIFATPQIQAGNGWMATKPSYEESYIIDQPIDTKSQYSMGYTFPALFRIGDNGWALVSETGVSGNYVGSRLSDPTSDGIYTIAFADKAENAGIGDATVSASLPLQTPWRTIAIGSTLAPVIESTVATDVVKPLYEPSQDYVPGRSAWSWLIWQDRSMNEKDQVTFIDLASELGFEYILIDALWDTNIGRDRMAELVSYAGSKNVGVLLWYNSNGYWNDAPQTPKNCMDSSPARAREMAWLKSIGVKGLKVDFFGGDKQVTMKLYEDILTDANRYGLMLNFHGTTLPRGWERMYPNFMTAEAVTASENLVFSQGFADKEAINSTIFPFIRNPVAAMDFGPVVLNDVLSRDQKRGTKRRTTDTFQMATAVLYQSPIQHFGITPNNLKEQPEYVIDYFKNVPAHWDDVRFVDGYPGKYIVLARRADDRWYIAATHADTNQMDIKISLPWLKGKTLDHYFDNGQKTGFRKTKVDADGNVHISMVSGGAVVLVCN